MAALTPATSAAVSDAPLEEGLAKNSIALPGLLFISASTMAPGAGIALAISVGAPFAGGALPASVVLAMVGCLLVAVGLGQLAKHIASSGGIATYIGESTSPAAAHVASWAYTFVYTAAIGSLALVFGNFLATAFVPSATGATYHALWLVGTLAMLVAAYLINVFGIRLSARAGIVLGSLEIASLVALSIFMIARAGHHNTLSVFTTHYATVKGFTGAAGIIGGSVYGFLAFVGFEAAAPAAEEARDPKKTIPRAVVGSCVMVGVFFIFATYAATVFYGPGRMQSFLAFNGGNPWTGLAKIVWGGGWVVVLLTLMNSCLACANGATVAASRTLVSMGQEGTLPRIFARIDRRHKSPVVALSVMFVVALVLALGLGEGYGPVKAFSLLSTVVTISILPLYFAAAIACPIYFYRYRRSEANVLLHLVLPLLGVAALIPAFFAGAGIKVFSFVGSLTYPTSLAGPIVGGWYVVGIVLAIYLFGIRPRRAGRSTSSPDPLAVGSNVAGS